MLCKRVCYYQNAELYIWQILYYDNMRMESNEHLLHIDL